MIQISLAMSNAAKANIPTMFALVQDFPREMATKYGNGWTIMVGHRPLLGDVEVTGANVYGRHWVAIDKNNDLHDQLLSKNEALNARLVIPGSKESIAKVALLGNKYRESYMEMEEAERYDALESKIRKLEGLPYSELMRRLREST